MSLTSLLTPTFRHGVHPDGHKRETEHLPIQRMPFVDRYVLPLSQHTGAPCRPVVKVGDRVQRGQVVAEPGGFVSMTLHSPVTGKVTALANRHHPNGKLTPAIEIEADPFATQEIETGPPVDPFSLSLDEFVSHVQKAGLVGMGGAAFPTHVKYKVPEGKTIRHLLVNGAECEPYLTTDHRLMVEQPEKIVRGIEIVAAHLGVEDTTIGIEKNKPDAIEAMQRALPPGKPIRVVPVKVKYPQGAEKMLIKAIYDVEVPSGGLPLDVGTVVNNVGTMAALAEYFDEGKPVIERVLTLAGPGMVGVGNLLVPIGTPIRAVVDHLGGLKPDTREVVMGGPMMGMPLSHLDVPVLKGTSGVLAFTEAETRLPKEYTCIRCGRCVEACPQFLNPSRLGLLSRAKRYEEIERFHIMDCIECGSCSFACPSGIPLVQLIRVAKSAIRERKRKGA